MSDKMIYTAYIITKGEFRQLLKYDFEYPILEYWGEPEEQEKLKQYFRENHYTKATPDIIEASDRAGIMLYQKASNNDIPKR